MENEFRKIVVSRTDNIGDVILSLPVFATLKKSFSEAETIALVGNYTSGIVRSSPHVNTVITSDADESLWATYKKLKAIGADVMVALFPRFKIAAAALLAGIPIRIGTAYRWYSVLFNKKVYEHRKDSVKSEAEYNLTLLEPLGCKEQILDTTLNIDVRASRMVDGFANDHCLSKFIAIHPGSGGSASEWDAENFRELIKEITNLSDLNVVVTGIASEHYTCAKICEGLGNAINTAGRFSLLEFVALLSKADLFISNSTGPLHIAAAVGTPLIGIYPNGKPMTPVRWAPLTDKKIILTPKDGSNDLSEISVSEVLESVRKMISPESK